MLITANVLAKKYAADPKMATRPFDVERDGLVTSEGAGSLVLEEYEHAKARVARIYCEISGYGNSNDAWSILAPHPKGDGVWWSMMLAFRDSLLNPGEVDLINPHAPSTVQGDLSDYKAILRMFGKEHRPLISATKS
jgi:3-oxoacyl-[acyl-carrier-protein] synthase II